MHNKRATEDNKLLEDFTIEALFVAVQGSKAKAFAVWCMLLPEVNNEGILINK